MEEAVDPVFTGDKVMICPGALVYTLDDNGEPLAVVVESVGREYGAPVIRSSEGTSHHPLRCYESLKTLWVQTRESRESDLRRAFDRLMVRAKDLEETSRRIGTDLRVLLASLNRRDQAVMELERLRR